MKVGDIIWDRVDERYGLLVPKIGSHLSVHPLTGVLCGSKMVLCGA